MNRKLVSKSNFVLRQVLNKEKHVDVLQDFVESILDIEIQKIEINKYLKNDKKQLPKEENYGVADMRIKQCNGEEINVGIQFIDGIHYLTQKMLIYYAKIDTNQLKYGNNREVVQTNTINILDCKYDDEEEYIKELLVCMEGGFEMNKSLGIKYIELPKFNINSRKIVSKKEAWIAYLKGLKIDLKKPEFEKILKLDTLLNKYWKDEKME